jgi:surface antigen
VIIAEPTYETCGRRRQVGPNSSTTTRKEEDGGCGARWGSTGRVPVRRSGRAWWVGALVSVVVALLMILGAVGGVPVAVASQTECFSYAYACTPGYDATNTEGGWAWKYYGGSYAATPTGYHNCTLYAAWRLEQNGLANPGLWGNAVEWINHTSHNHTPAVGSIAWWGSEMGGGFGHVAYVEQLRGAEVFIRADNYASSGGYTDAGWIPASSVDAFLHPHDVQTGPPGEGSFVSYAGNVYRIAGGAPMYINSWAPFGGPQPTSELSASQWAALRQMPADGTTISGAETGQVYKIAGGAPLYLSSCDAGCGAPIAVSQYAIEHNGTPPGGTWHLNTVPAGGTTIETPSSETGRIYKVAGGAPLYLSSCDAGCGSPVEVNQYTIDGNGAPPGAKQHLNTVPADGTTIETPSSETGRIYKVAGGAPLYLSSCDAGCGSPVEVNQYTIDALGAPAGAVLHLNAVPANGTLVSSTATGMVYRIAGGAPLYVSKWSAIGGPQPSVGIDQWDIENTSNPAAHLNAVPANGTFIETSTGALFRIAGGAPFALSSWTLFGGEQSHVIVDEWDIENTTNAAAHLNATPANGTTVEGLPSDTYWIFEAGLRSQITTIATAVAVDDLGLAAYPAKEEAGAQPAGSSGTTVAGTGPSTTPSSSNGVLGTKSHQALKRPSVGSRARAECHKIRNHRKRAKCTAELAKCHKIKNRRERKKCYLVVKRRHHLTKKRGRHARRG